MYHLFAVVGTSVTDESHLDTSFGSWIEALRRVVGSKYRSPPNWKPHSRTTAATGGKLHGPTVTRRRLQPMSCLGPHRSGGTSFSRIRGCRATMRAYPPLHVCGAPSCLVSGCMDIIACHHADTAVNGRQARGPSPPHPFASKESMTLGSRT